jgi:ABC-type polysaccharide/polyol phosphate export permease
MFLDVIRSGFTLAVRSIRIQIRQHALGYAWALIIPVLYAACYIFIKRELSGHGSAQTVDGAWDVLRAFAGITLFQCWMQIVQDMSAFIRTHRGLLRGIDVGPIPFFLAVVFEGVIALAIRSLLIIIAIPILGLPFPIDILSWIWFFFSLLALLISAATVGLLLAPWSVLYADVRKALTSISLPMILISPIFYPAVEQQAGALYWLNIFNPIASPLAVISCALRETYSIYMLPMVLFTVGALMILCWSLKLLGRQVPILLERMGN